MGHKIIFNVDAKEATFPDCVKLSPNESYQDTIIRDKEYNGESQVSVLFTNMCSKSFVVPETKLFFNNDLGGNFEAIVSEFSIGANQTINIPVKYYGIAKDTSKSRSYIISLNNSSVNYLLNIVQPVITHPPVIQDIEIILENRQNKQFSLSDFESYYSDLDGHTLDAILLEGDLSAFRLNGQPISSPAEISAYDISIGKLSYMAKDTDEEVNVVVKMRVKNESGEVSII
ncbi:hypothetical protein PG616_11875 [Riemerella anatipestifer]|nr:hypothetical protein [Riemerella anatipestifer]